MRTIYQFGQNLDQETMDDIKECIDNILRIPEGSIPLARGLGTSWSSLSEITPDMENDYAVEIVEKIETYETRVAVDEVTFEHDPDNGEVIVRIIFEGGEDDE
jgi:phage baseplate assembly protein W